MDAALTQATQDQLRAGQHGLLLIADNNDAFAARALSARSSEHTLDLMYYLWHDDRTGRLLMREVLAAAERGVRVRMLIDDINPQSSDRVYLSLNSHPNIQLRLFNPSGMRNGSLLRGLELVARMFAMTRRMHTKAWIADGRLAIVGGRNIGDAYFDAADTNFRDLDVLLLGRGVEETAAIFEAYWNCQAAWPVHRLHPKRARRMPVAIEAPEASMETVERLRGKRSIDEFIAAGDVHWISAARVVADPPEKVIGARRDNWLTRELLPIIRGSGSSVEIVSPYFIPGRKGLAALVDLIGRGVDVSVLTNSLAATDVAAVHGAYANYRVALLKAGVKLFELQPFGGKQRISVFGSKGASLHTKAFVVDGARGFVGSFNFDPRSASLNAEMGIIFDDVHLAGEMQRRFRREMGPQTSYRLFLERNRLRWEGILDDAVEQFSREPEAGIYRRLIAGVIRWLPIESQL